MWEKRVNDKSNSQSILVVTCHKIIDLFLQLLHIKTGWVIEGINSVSAKIQTPESRSSKLNYNRNFLEGAHQCQTDIVQSAGIFAPSLASFDEAIESASGPACGPACSLCQYPVPSILLLCSKGNFAVTLQDWSWRLILVILPGAWMCLCWDRGHWRCAALLCTAHTSVIYIEPWLSSSAGWWYCCGAGRSLRRCRSRVVLAHCLLWWQGRCHWLGGCSEGVEAFGLPDEE